MNARLFRLLLWLYPRRIRDRYGSELIDLHRDLDRHDANHRARLVLDMFVGALAARTTRERARLIAGGVALIAAVAFGIAMSAGHAANRPPARLALTATPIKAHSCFVTSGSECSLSACQQFISRSAATSAVLDLAASAVPRHRPSTKSHCTAYPRTRPLPPVFVGGSSTARPATPVRVPAG